MLLTNYIIVFIILILVYRIGYVHGRNRALSFLLEAITYACDGDQSKAIAKFIAFKQFLKQRCSVAKAKARYVVDDLKRTIKNKRDK